MTQNWHHTFENDLLAINGEFTVYEAAEIKPLLLDVCSKTANLSLDLSGLTRIDTAAVQLLAALKKKFSSDDKRMEIVRHSDPVVEVFELCNLGRHFGDPVVISGKAKKSGGKRK